MLGHIRNHGKLLDIVVEWHQLKLNASLKKACMLGGYKMAILIIRAGANNFEQCIKDCTQKNRLNHILAYLRLCQAAYEDDQTAVDILLEGDEDKISNHPRYSSLVDFHTILLPLIDNGTLTITEPLHIALMANHLTMAGKILMSSSKRHSTGIVDWHGLELTELETNWLKTSDFSNVQLFCLSFNLIKQIPSQVCNLNTLVKFQVAFNKLTYVPTAIFQLLCIENIDLSYNSIVALPEALLGKVSSSLHTLTLSNNLLGKFPDYFVDSGLKILDLSRNRFTVVPESVYSIKQLESLNMSHNSEIRFIPYELGGLKHLKVTSFDGLPYTFNVPNSSLMDFVKKRFKSMQTVSHYDVVVIGFPNHSQIPDSVCSKLTKPKLDCGILKFVSPTHFLSLHHIFKLPNTVYVLLWDCQNRQEPNELHHVLRHLSIHTPDSPTIVTACWNVFNNQLEMELEEMINVSLWNDLRATVQLEHLLLDSEENDSSSTVRPYSSHALCACISNLSESVKVTQFVPGSYFSCGQALTKKQELYRCEVKCPMLSEDDFWELVSSMPSHDLSSREELPKLVSYLTLKGIVVHIPGPTGSQSYYVFNRQWFCTVMGNILSRRGTQMIQSFSGVVHQEVLIDLLACPSFQLPLPNALQYMLNKEAVALALSSEKWLIPSMLPELPDSAAHIDPGQYSIRRQYTFNLTPATFWCRLIAHLLMNMDNFVREVSDINSSNSELSLSHQYTTTLPRQGVVDWSYWNSGILCWQNACHLVYSIEFISTCTDPYQETIEIRVPNSLIGYRTMHRLSLIVDTLLKNWYPRVWSSVEIWVPCSYCIHTGIPHVPSISFQDCVLAVSKGVGVKCMQHPDKIASIAKIIPDLIQEDITIDVFLPPGSVQFNMSDKSTCISPPPTETVFKGTYSKHLVAVKPFPHKKMQGIGDDQRLMDQECLPLLQLWSEFEVLRHIQPAKCPFIISVVGVCPDPLCLLFPFARWSSLEDVFHTKDITIPHMVRIKMIFQLAYALSVLQSYRIIHRNVCLANLLVFSLSADDTINIKLSGFSNACYSIFQGIGVGQFGSFPAPEMLRETEGEYDERVDIFAFAFVAYEIITQTRMRVTSKMPLQTHVTVIRPTLEPVQIRAPYLVPLISKCWHPVRTKRPFASKVVQHLKQPLHVLVRDGKLVNEQHEFFAASARFTRIRNNFHSDLFVCSGQLMGNRTSYLACESLPGLSFEMFKQLPSEFVICVGCIGSQLWVSFYGKKVRVYSALNMEFINEFTFNHHVVAIAISPTSVYLGLENGVLQVYDVSESVPTEPSFTKIVKAGEEFKCLEAMDDSLICATKNNIFCLHPDTLDIEEKWNLDSEKEIRCIVISRCSRSEAEDRVEGNDLLWVGFRRWEKVLVMNPWTGQCYYSIDCARVLDMPASKVYVQSVRVVLDTVWVGLNTGHILIFASNHQEPKLLTHLKVHRDSVRQLLLLHPSYMGPTTVLSSSEITRSLCDPQSSLIADQHKLNFPDSVLVVSFGNGLDHSLCSVDKNGGVMEGGEDSEANTNGLFAVILEGASISRMVQVERNSDRAPLLFMEGYSDSDDELYAVPPDDIVIYDSPRRLVPSNIPRNDTWTAPNTAMSPVSSNMKNESYYDVIPRRHLESIESLSLSDSRSSSSLPPPPLPLPPRDSPPSPPKSLDTVTSDKGPKVPKKPKSPLGLIFGSKHKTKESGKSPANIHGLQSPRAVDSSTEVIKYNSRSDKLPEVGIAEVDEESDDDFDAYVYAYQDHIRAQSYTLPPSGSKPFVFPRRMTCDDSSRPDIEDSAEGYDPYVRMDSFYNKQDSDLRLTANKANQKAKQIRQRRMKPQLSEVLEEDYMSREDFLGNRVDLDDSTKKVKPKPPPKPVKWYVNLYTYKLNYTFICF